MSFKRSKGSKASASHIRNVRNVEDGGSVRSARRSHKRKTMVESAAKKSRRWKVLLAAIVSVAVVVAAVGVGVFAFYKTTDARLSFGQTNAADALVAAEDDSPIYLLMSADLAISNVREPSPNDHALMVARVNAQDRHISFLNIPSKLYVKMSDGESHPIDEAQTVGGDAELVSCASSLLGVGINHFVKTNSAGMEGIVDALDGITLEVSDEVDDPSAGIYTILKGEQTLDGPQSLTLLRATNFLGGFQTCATNRSDFTFALFEKALSMDGIAFANIVGRASEFVSMDMQSSSIIELADKLRPASDISCSSYVIPYNNVTDGLDDKVRYEISSSNWESVRSKFCDGTGAESDVSRGDVDKSSFKVEVRNGTNTSGAAASLASSLESFGYQIGSVGNTGDGIIYPETLVVYTTPDAEGAAEAVMADMGAGRLVNGGDYYSSPCEVIAIIGKDWMSF